ncbi:Hypothetical predicted protein [Podarcis lilfordi]|uniref:Uncharacterized protein n=1 Tax=Podarcis lilfordi TaxID=74358 RepID=A0AA35KW14_9SAUR|nr:Hypothetical predicted protein [Podarcis lilfordi]
MYASLDGVNRFQMTIHKITSIPILRMETSQTRSASSRDIQRTEPSINSDSFPSKLKVVPRVVQPVERGTLM